MKLLEALNNFLDSRSDEEKAYDSWNAKTPLQRRVQRLRVYIQGEAEPILTDYVLKDRKDGFGTMRWASNEDTFNSMLRDWLNRRGTKGIQIDNIWYSPKSIVRIDLGEQTIEAI